MPRTLVTTRILYAALWLGSTLMVVVASYVALRHNSMNILWLMFTFVTLPVLAIRLWSTKIVRAVVIVAMLVAVGVSAARPLPISTLGLDIVRPSRSVEVVTGTLGAVHRSEKVSAWTRRGAEYSKLRFLRKTPLIQSTPIQFVTFGHRGGSYVVDEIWFGTDILRIPFKLARLRGLNILKSAHLPETTGWLKPESGGYRVINRFDANPLFRLKADPGLVSTYNQRRLEWPVRFLWLLAFIAVIVAGLGARRSRFGRFC